MLQETSASSVGRGHTMNLFARLIACLILAIPACGVRQERQAIPGAVRVILDQRYAGWRVASVSGEVRDWVGDRLGPTPNVIVGDFDGNGQADCAVLIEYPNTDAPEKAYTHYLEVLAFLDDAGSPRLVRVRDRQPGPNPEQFLALQRRGAEGFDFEANKKFTYAHDSIGEWYFGKAGGTYIFSDGRFRYVHEAD